MVGLLELSFVCIQALWSPARVITEFSANISHQDSFPPRLLSLARGPALRRVSVVQNVLHFRTMEASVLLRTFNEERMFL